MVTEHVVPGVDCNTKGSWTSTRHVLFDDEDSCTSANLIPNSTAPSICSHDSFLVRFLCLFLWYYATIMNDDFLTDLDIIFFRDNDIECHFDFGDQKISSINMEHSQCILS